jgi:hypothetical protein
MADKEFEKLTDRIIKYYNKKYTELKNPKAFFEKRGLIGIKAGYSDSSLYNILSDSQIELFKNKGLIKNDEEYFKNCAVFYDGYSLYGIDIDTEKEKHICIKDNEPFIFNRNLTEKEIIITGSLMTALKLESAGFENIQFVSGDTGRYIKYLNDKRVKTVILTFKDAGLKDRLLDSGIRVKQIRLKTIIKEEIENLIKNSELIEPSCAETSDMSVKKENSNFYFEIGNLTYRVVGVKEVFATHLKVNIKTTCTGKNFFDTIDLYSSRARQNYAARLSCVIDAEPKKIERDLTDILEYLETERDRILNRVNTQNITVTDKDKETAHTFLLSPDIFKAIENDMTKLGYVSETANKLLVYLASVSRFLPKPLDIYIRADSAGGKSALLNTLEKMLPPEDIWKALTISTQALHYVEEEKFLGKVFIMGESIHDEAIEGLVRQMQSEGEISRLVTMKDEKTGEMRARLIQKKVRMSFMVTSTALHINPENASRCLMLYADESAEQTKRVQKRLGESHDFKGKVIDKSESDKIIQKHITAQRILENIEVFNPLWKRIKFPSQRPAMRRAYDQFLTLIDTVCFLRQFQKQRIKKLNPVTGTEVTGIECDIEDYTIAYNLFTDGVLKQGAYGVSTGTKRLYEMIRKLVKKISKQKQANPLEVTFTSRDLREYTNLGYEFIKKHLRILTSYEYLEIEGGKRQGVRYSYRLRDDAPIEELDISVIPKPEDLKV